MTEARAICEARASEKTLLNSCWNIINIESASLSYSFSTQIYCLFDLTLDITNMCERFPSRRCLLVHASNQREIISQTLVRQGDVQKMWKMTSFGWWKALLVLTATTWGKFSQFRFLSSPRIFCCLLQKETFPWIYLMHTKKKLKLLLHRIKLSQCSWVTRPRPRLHTNIYFLIT